MGIGCNVATANLMGGCSRATLCLGKCPAKQPGLDLLKLLKHLSDDLKLDKQLIARIWILDLYEIFCYSLYLFLLNKKFIQPIKVSAKFRYTYIHNTAGWEVDQRC
jgi:hypothetical protein